VEREVLKKTEARVISPFGGSLIDLSANPEEREELQHYAAKLPRLQLTPRNTCDLELLANGAFSPLDRYMGKDDYHNVIGGMRLANGVLFPIPVTLSIDATTEVRLDSEITLADEQNDPLAIMQVEEIYEWNLDREAQLVYGTTDLRHPLVAEMHSWRKLRLSCLTSVAAAGPKAAGCLGSD
jgi:sulfate adenylyltransferase